MYNCLALLVTQKVIYYFLRYIFVDRKFGEQATKYRIFNTENLKMISFHRYSIILQAWGARSSITTVERKIQVFIVKTSKQIIWRCEGAWIFGSSNLGRNPSSTSTSSPSHVSTGVMLCVAAPLFHSRKPKYVDFLYKFIMLSFPADLPDEPI